MVPGSAMVVPMPVPEADRCAPSACADTVLTPVHAEISRPPSTTGTARFACTARIWSPTGSVTPSGKFCTFVARYVAIETSPSDTNSTSVYVLPTGVCSVLANRSVTEVMMFVCVVVGSIQKNVARIASPTCGFVGLKPFTSTVPRSLNVPFTWSSAMGLAVTASSGPAGPTRSGPTRSVQPPASKAVAARTRGPESVVHFRIVPPCFGAGRRFPCGVQPNESGPAHAGPLHELLTHSAGRRSDDDLAGGCETAQQAANALQVDVNHVHGQAAARHAVARGDLLVQHHIAHPGQTHLSVRRDGRVARGDRHAGHDEILEARAVRVADRTAGGSTARHRGDHSVRRDHATQDVDVPHRGDALCAGLRGPDGPARHAVQEVRRQGAPGTQRVSLGGGDIPVGPRDSWQHCERGLAHGAERRVGVRTVRAAAHRLGDARGHEPHGQSNSKTEGREALHRILVDDSHYSALLSYFVWSWMLPPVRYWSCVSRLKAWVSQRIASGPKPGLDPGSPLSQTVKRS